MASNKQVKNACYHSLGLFKSGALASLLKSPLPKSLEIKMKVILIAYISLFLLVGCDSKENVINEKPPTIIETEEFNVTFKFGGNDVMKEFEKEFIKNNIQHKLNQDGSISYYNSDKEKVQIFGDKIVNNYISNKK